MANDLDSDGFYEAAPIEAIVGADPFGDDEAFDLAYGEGPHDGGFDAEAAFEGESEDQFVGRLVRRVSKRMRRLAPILRRLAPLAARAVAGAVPGGAVLGKLLREDEDGFDGFDAFDMEDDLLLGEAEDEDEGDFEDDGFDRESELDDLAEALLYEAARVPSDEEAASLAGGITITITGPAPLAVRRVAPILSRGTARIVRVLRRSPATRPLVPAAGAIAKATARSLARRAAAGKPITPRLAARTMARQAQRTLSKPSRVAKAVVRNAVKRRRLDKAAIRRVEG